MQAMQKSRRSTGRVTLNDVAQLASVSPITVSRALRGERSVAADLVLRVVQASERLGYIPDPAAKALASQKSNHIAILIPKLSNTLFVDLLDAAQQALRTAGFQALIGVTQYDNGQEEQLLKEQLSHRPAGMLITGLNYSEATRTLIANSRIQCVHLMDLPNEHLPVEKDTEQPYCVGFKQSDAGVALTEHLLSQGYRRIAFAAAQLDERVMQRMHGWRQALQKAKLYDPTLEWLNPASSSLALGATMFEQILGQSPAIDAIFFCNDDLAQGALLAASRLGISVPGRIAIAGFNDLTGSDQMVPTLTTVRTPRTQIGLSAANMLLALIRKEAEIPRIIDLGYEVVVRDST
jgi:LacI family transcriptional regulator, gluconate utilization system Gnt-I transcriptional repressor